MGMHRAARAMVGGAVLVGLGVVLTACGYGFTGEATHVGRASATLTGSADNTEPGVITWWFEYGTTLEYGATTPPQTAAVTDVIPVEATVTGLAATTTYHYRLCVEDAEGHGTCGDDATFQTTRPDTVRGNALTANNVGIILDVVSDRDGSNPAGAVGYYLPDPGGMRGGRVTCVNVVGTRATIGMDTTYSAYSDAVITVEQVGSGGLSRWELDFVAQAPSECPAPPTGPFGWLGETGGFQVVDTP